MTDESLSPEDLAAKYLARFDWHRSRAPGPPPPSRTLSIWERWIREDPERAWELFEALVRLRPEDDEVLEQVWYRLRQLLARHGRTFETRVRALVGANARLTQIAPAAELDPAAHRPLPLDIPDLVRTYLINATYAPDAHELSHIIQSDPEVALPLVLEVISRGPLHRFTSFDTFSPLHDLLRLHGPTVVDAVEAAAAESVLVRRCLWQVAQVRHHPPEKYDITVDVSDRLEHATFGTTDYNSDDPAGIAHSLSPEHERIVAAWFIYQDTFWAWERIDNLVRMDPEPAFRVITLLTESSPSDEILAGVGAGPLEDFLSAHGRYLIDRVELRARADKRFRQCLACVWHSDMPDTIWDRVRAAATADD